MDWNAVSNLITIGCTVVTVFSGFKLVEYRVKILEGQIEKMSLQTSKIPVIERDIQVMNHRIDDLEKLTQRKEVD